MFPWCSNGQIQTNISDIFLQSHCFNLWSYTLPPYCMLYVVVYAEISHPLISPLIFSDKFLPPASAVEVIELEPFVCLSVCLHSHDWTAWPMCLCPSWQKDYRAKGLCLKGMRQVSQRSGIFIVGNISKEQEDSQFMTKILSSMRNMQGNIES